MGNEFDLLICNGNVFTGEEAQQRDVGIKHGKICAIESSLPREAGQILDVGGMLVLPGMSDVHTHMGIPIMDTYSADDFTSGSIAAACGGITTIFDFTVQEQGQSLREARDQRLKRAKGKCHVDYGLHINITDQPLRSLTEIPRLVSEGYTSYKMFTTYKMMIKPAEFREVLRQLERVKGFPLLHAEDNDVVVKTTEENIRRGNFAPIYHARSRPAKAEALAIGSAAQIAKEAGVPLYIVHLSSKAGLHAALLARGQGVRIYLETCPQYLLLNEECYYRPNGHYFITTPPLRTEEDNDALWQALASDEIDVVATDHCAFTAQQKEAGHREFHRTPNGLPGVETLFPLLYTWGVAKGRISLKQLVRLLAQNPARIFGISSRKGEIRVGSDADIVVWNASSSHVISAATSHGKSDWSPYEGMRIAGSLVYTILRGQIIAKDGQFTGQNVLGELLLR